MSHPLDRAHCPGCDRDVPIRPPREANPARGRPADLRWRYQDHRVARSATAARCRNSRADVLPQHLPDHLSPESPTPCGGTP